MTLFLTFPVYLAQWYAYEQHDLSGDLMPSDYRYDSSCPCQQMEIVETRRGSVERTVLIEGLRRRPRETPPVPSAGATLRIEIPWGTGKDPARYNWLPPKEEYRLQNIVRMRFRKDLYMYMERHYDAGRRGRELQECIEEYMRLHHIADTDANYESVKQQYRRQRDVYRKSKKT